MRRSVRHIALWALTVFFAWATVLLAAGPVRALRRASPLWVFWPAAVAVPAVLWLIGFDSASLAIAAVILVVGLFTEIEIWTGNRGLAAIGASGALAAAAGLGFGAWCRSMKTSPGVWLTKWIEPGLAKLKEMNPSLSFDIESVVAQVPSGVLIIALLTLALALLTEATWLRFLGLQRPRLGERWTSFRLWDVTIYALMLALLAAFTRHDVKLVTVIGLNVLNVLVVLYFFQGMAVAFKAFDVFGVGYFWRGLFGFVLTFQLALLVAAVGVADYWLDFRSRLRRPIGPKPQL